MSICIRHTRRQAFPWFLNKRDDTVGHKAIKLGCRRLHGRFRIFYALSAVALLADLCSFASRLTANAVFRPYLQLNIKTEVKWKVFKITFDNIELISEGISKRSWMWIFSSNFIRSMSWTYIRVLPLTQLDWRW